MELNLVVAIWAFAFMTAFAAWISARHFRYWMWARDVRWNYHRQEMLHKIRIRMNAELNELKRNAPGDKHPKKKMAYQPKLVKKSKQVDEVAYEYSVVAIKLDQLLEKGPP